MKKMSKRLKITVIMLPILIVLVYLLFFAYFSPFEAGYPIYDEISEKTALRECPQVVVTDYDREFLNRILNDPQFEILEKETEHVYISITADEAGFERYAFRPNENYTVEADNYTFDAPSISIQFEYSGGLYREQLYLSAESSDMQLNYKCVSIERFDGKLIRQYWDFHGRYERTTYTYGIVGYIKLLLSAMFGC